MLMTWGQFRSSAPEIADAGRDLLYQFGVGLAFLATVRVDGGPRLHPMCPVLAEDALFGFVIPSPKLGDLLRDPRYALHSFPAEDNEDAFYITGAARRRTETGLRRMVADAFLAERNWVSPPPGFDRQALIEFRISTCLLTRTSGHGDVNPRHTVWKAPGVSAQD